MINTNLLRSVSIGGYDEIEKVREHFQTLVDLSSATIEDVLNHILTIDNAGHDTIPCSMGMDWIHRNPNAFREVVVNVDRFVTLVLEVANWAQKMQERAGDRVHPTIAAGLDLGREFFPSFIMSWRLMRLLSPTMRESFVNEFYPRWGATNNLWITAAFQTGVPRSQIASAIIERLRAVRVERGMANDVDDFLRYGAGDHNDQAAVIVTMRRLGLEPTARAQVEEIMNNPLIGFDKIEAMVKEREDALERGEQWEPRSEFSPSWLNHDADRSSEAMWSYRFAELKPWLVLSRHELMEALEVCAGKMPGATIAALDTNYSARRLGYAEHRRVTQAAILNMTEMDGVNQEVLSRRLELVERIQLARQLEAPKETWGAKPLAQFLFKIVYDLDEGERWEFWSQVVKPALENVDASTCYRAWRQLKLENRDIEYRLLQWLEPEGWWVGKIKCIPHPKGGTQKGVPVGDEIFVQARDDHRYFPTEGDEVLFKPLNGRRLSPCVTAVYFTPVTKDVQ